MEVAVTIEQFGRLLQSEEDNALLRVVRQLQSITNWEAADPGARPQVCWTGWA